ncbi:hypothetical protein [Enterococcus faecalis]|uniref:hypothetical protein n=1 Tax=Enterococcus faecalis TaxID=1351 RepID=UPI0001B6F57F|nr:hypothetical protein [Enterococcus faecalis]EEU91595.1 predicted protein [Enterococcus faecalis T11]EGO2709277.1 hypothetical protein [Enterococcus faecalis]EGO7586672.1 hypothetical protein [Enterococcus faecalis]EGO7773184.1 hypothetical protein [Enterococcus faecalis]EGO8418799.1 hypothetical protein [Enterococcus faecalis]
MALAEKFYFPSNNGGEVKGISDSGIETFSGNSIKGLAREILQNSLDANKNSSEPAYVEFELFQLPFRSLPGSVSLEDAFKKAREFWERQTSKKAKKFFDQTLDQINEPVNMLRISDFHTTGLTGSKGDYNTPWVNLTKSAGVSDKENGTMGSFGIGKFATFAASSLRTVFYNTVAEDGESAFQGISRLTSFNNDAGDITQGIGYLGSHRSDPEYTNISLDPNYKRGELDYGTDIYIAGFKNVDNDWQEEIIASVLDGFLYAIFIGNLEVKVGSITINKHTLTDVIENYKDYFSENAHYYYNVLTSSDTHYKEENYNNDGLIKLWILLEDDLSNKTAIYRGAGMKIKEIPFQNSLLSGAAVMVIEGKEIQNKLIPLENPTHTNWEVKRAEENRPFLKNYIKGIYDFVKQELLVLSDYESLDEVDSDVGEYLPLISEDDKNKTLEESITNESKSIVQKEVKRIKTKSGIPDGEYLQEEVDDNGEVIVPGNSGHKKSENPIIDKTKVQKDTPGEGYGNADEKRNYKHIGISQIRVLAQDKNAGRYTVVFKPEKACEDSKIRIRLIGETGNEIATLLDVKTIPNTPIKITNNVITGLNLKKDALTRLIVTIDFDDYVAMEVDVYGI